MLKKFFGLFVIASIIGGLLAACGGTTSSSEAKKLLLDLTSKGRLLVNQPGWVHVTEKIVYDTDQKDRGTLPSGQTVPLVQMIEIWYHINEEKRVYEYVWTMNTTDGQTVETIVFRNNLAYNLTTNISSPVNPYPLSLDFEFADEMDNFILNSENHPIVTNGQVDGKQVTIFTLNEKLATPRTTADYTQPVNAVGSIASFDSESGLLVKLERTVILADGSKRTFYSDTLAVETGVQPPLEVKDYVNGIW
jgi:hypothetical protein